MALLKELVDEFPEIRDVAVHPDKRNKLADILSRFAAQAVERARPSIEEHIAGAMAAGYHVTTGAVPVQPLVPRRPGTQTAPHADAVLGSVSADSQRGRLLMAYFNAAPAGLTDSEAAINASFATWEQGWKRCSELRNAGLIAALRDEDGEPLMRRSGRSGFLATVCVITPEGEAVAAGLDV
jgi:hypothetical protein